MPLLLVGLCLVIVVGLYFYNNPLAHGSWFMNRRFINWFPLGMTYAFLYMGRYNLTVSKGALGSLMSNQDFGWIFGIGTVVYGLSFVVNGPLVDMIGGKRGIIIAAVGASLANIVLGVLTYLVVTNRLKMRLVVAFSVIYALNMYFQSYGAVSIIKVKAYWFHVRERGVFGAIFGTLISFGAYFAFDWGQAIVNMAAANPKGEVGWLHALIQRIFVPDDTHGMGASLLGGPRQQLSYRRIELTEMPIPNPRRCPECDISPMAVLPTEADDEFDDLIAERGTPETSLASPRFPLASRELPTAKSRVSGRDEETAPPPSREPPAERREDCSVRSPLADGHAVTVGFS